LKRPLLDLVKKGETIVGRTVSRNFFYIIGLLVMTVHWWAFSITRNVAYIQRIEYFLRAKIQYIPEKLAI